MARAADGHDAARGAGTLGAVRVPIACTLTVDDAATRIDEWRAVLDRSIASVHRTSPTEIVLTLRDDRAGLDDLVGLARREVACCAFFDFTLDIAVDAVALVVTVPADAAGVLDDFAALAG
jgi:hypothetical protein